MLDKTTTSLLDGLRDARNEGVWREFDERYRPRVIGFCRRLGLGHADAAEVAQETLARFVETYRTGAYDRERGRLHSWILGIAKRCTADLRRRRAADPEQRGQSTFEKVADDASESAAWDEEWRQALLRAALRRLREQTRTDPKTLRALEALAFEHRRPADVAHELAMTANDVYLAKHRCLSRLRAIVAELEDLSGLGPEGAS